MTTANTDEPENRVGPPSQLARPPVTPTLTVAGVNSVNGRQGDVTLLASDIPGIVNPEGEVTTVNGRQGHVVLSHVDVGVQENATANDTNANLRNRNTHTGTQPAASISDIQEAVQDIVANMIIAGPGMTVSYDDPTGKITISATASGPAAPSAFAIDWHDVRDVAYGFAEHNGITGGDGQAVVTVTTTADSGTGSLRAALAGNLSNRYVKFSPSIAGQTIVLSSSVTASGSNITLDGVESGVVIRGHVIRFTGTNVIVAGMEFGPPGLLNDSLTFRRDADTAIDQLFAVYGITGGAAPASAESSDSIIDIIWRRNRWTRGTIAGGLFQLADRFCLIHSGDDDLNEGQAPVGAYQVTFARNRITKINQRFPLMRDAHIDFYNNLVDRFGNPNGGTTPLRMGDIIRVPAGFVNGLLATNNVVQPMANGETAWNGVAATNPSTAWFSPSATSQGTMNMKAVGSYLKPASGRTPTQTEVDAAAVFTPPYARTLAPANDALQTFLENVVGASKQKLSPLTGYKNPAASHGFIKSGAVVTAKVQGDTPASVVCQFNGTTIATLAHQGSGIWTGTVNTSVPNVGVIGTVRMRATSGAVVADSPAYDALVLP